MQLLPTMGLLVALIASPLLLAIFNWRPVNQFSMIPRLSLWLAAATVLVIAAAYTQAWRVDSGLQWPTWRGLGLAILATAFLLIVLGVYSSWRSRFAPASPKQLQLQQSLFGLPFSRRCFVVVTAAVTEEFLYRGYAIGIGQHLFGSIWLACVVSVVAFTLGHLRWGLAHLVPVFLCTLIITLLFVSTRNLLVCMLVHAILDGMGVLVMPIIMARRRSARAAG